MAAPWSIVLNKHIFSFILDDILPVLSNKDSNRTLLFWDWFTLKVWLKISSSEFSEVISHAANTEVWNVTIPLIFKHTFTSWVEEADAWSIFLCYSNKISKSGLNSIRDSRGHEKNITLELFSSVSKSILIALPFLFSEENEGWVFVSKDWFDIIFRERDQSWDRCSFGEFYDTIHWGSAIVS